MTSEEEVYDALKYRVDVDEYGTRRYYNSANQLHCEDGPAIVCTNGYREWWQNGQPHRDNGPAAVWPDGGKIWHQNGLRHREDGPAVEYASGDLEWWLYGVRYSEQNYYAKLKTLEQTP